MSPHLPLPDDLSADPALAREYSAARARGGAVMAILRAMGPRSELLQAFLALSDAALYGPAALGRREREVLAVATSEANEAGYSAEVHRELLEGLGDESQADARDAALIEFARSLTLAPSEAGEAVARLREHLEPAEVYDAVAVVGLLNFANRAALATGITSSDDLP
jgi:uncharacterized peroxidase-related enzyme